ncbi:molybdenum cofactor biosynthesis protein MoaE [Corynebacterium ammoniagenes]|uniref:Molybdopterin converting factor n=1 Tax=Corynebacterium ammoniagenes TaxID=1697 RepID=A0AAV5G3D7_CORAM|nr:molybdenum cofactor biosynthesis protein MoaE [Corynebacterium ammoniagenes]GJN43614.1 molybdopterin converting factor [Corynebacterium ammoniagenes]
MSTNHDPAHDPDYVHEQTGKVIQALMMTEPIEDVVEKARAEVITDAMGAVVTFDGVVRDHDGGQGVSKLIYSSHPLAQQEIEAVTARISKQHPHVRLWCAHRTGALNIGDLAFTVIAAAAHRREAFEAASQLADAVKAEVPIWKEQELSSGGTQWVGLE